MQEENEAVEKMTDRYRMGEYFSGPGGLALGAHLAAGDVELPLRLEHAWAVDIDSDSCRTYIDNIPGASSSTVIQADVRGALDSHDLGPIDGFAFGFPCNDFSAVGKRRGLEGKFGPLYRAGVEVLERMQPKWFVAENVGGITNANQGEAFRRILREMRAAGYAVVPHLYKFEHYGVPQRRHRIIVVGLRNDVSGSGLVFRPPAATHGLTTERSLVSAGSALSRPYASDVTHRELTRQSDRVIQRLEYIGPGQNAFTAPIPPELRLNVKGATISSIYRRLVEDEPAYTVTGSGGGGTHMYHWKQARALTNRERARLQTFPDEFNFVGRRDSVRKQIGMAVPVEGARAVFTALFRTLRRIDYPAVDSNLPGFLQ